MSTCISCILLHVFVYILSASSVSSPSMCGPETPHKPPQISLWRVGVMQGLVPSPPKVIQKSQTFTILNSDASDTLLVLGMTSVLKNPFTLDL